MDNNDSVPAAAYNALVERVDRLVYALKHRHGINLENTPHPGPSVVETPIPDAAPVADAAPVPAAAPVADAAPDPAAAPVADAAPATDATPDPNAT